jgi:hypothetical protein
LPIHQLSRDHGQHYQNPVPLLLGIPMPPHIRFLLFIWVKKSNSTEAKGDICQNCRSVANFFRELHKVSTNWYKKNSTPWNKRSPRKIKSKMHEQSTNLSAGLELVTVHCEYDGTVIKDVVLILYGQRGEEAVCICWRGTVRVPPARMDVSYLDCSAG